MSRPFRHASRPRPAPTSTRPKYALDPAPPRSPTATAIATRNSSSTSSNPVLSDGTALPRCPISRSQLLRRIVASAATIATAPPLPASAAPNNDSTTPLSRSTTTTYLPRVAERLYLPRRRSYLPADPSRVASQFNPASRVLVMGETHNNPMHHRMEFEILRSVHEMAESEGMPMAIGMEMFYRQHQNILDDFIKNKRSFTWLKRSTSWDQTWGYDFNCYAKILSFAQTNQIQLVGLNAPNQLIQIVRDTGLDNVDEMLKPYLPSMDMNVPSHKRRFQDTMLNMMATHSSDMDRDAYIQRLYECETLWDEYMAESATWYLNHNPGLLAIVAGSGHVLGRDGIPDRIQRRTGLRPFTVVAQDVGWTDEGLPDIRRPPSFNDADAVWFTQSTISTQTDTV